HRSLGLEPHRRLARRQSGRGSCESCGLCDDVVVLRPPEPHRTHVRGAAVAARDGSAWPWARARASARRLVVEPAEIQDPPHVALTPGTADPPSPSHSGRGSQLRRSTMRVTAWAFIPCAAFARTTLHCVTDFHARERATY